MENSYQTPLIVRKINHFYMRTETYMKTSTCYDYNDGFSLQYKLLLLHIGQNVYV